MSDIYTLDELAPWEWGEDAPEIIKKVLNDKNASDDDRLLAAQLAGDHVVLNDDMAENLLAIVEDVNENELLRAQAAVSFGAGFEYADMMDFDDFSGEDDMFSEDVFNKAQEALHKLYKDKNTPKIVKRRILEGTVRGPRPWHDRAVRSAFAIDDLEWKITAVFCMGYLKGFEVEILEALETNEHDLFYEAVMSAGRCEVKDAWPFIKDILYDRNIDKWLLIAAIEAAARINPEESLDILMEYENSEDEDIAAAAEDALASETILARTEFGDDDFDEEF